MMLDLTYSKYNILNKVNDEVFYLFNIRTGNYILLDIQKNCNFKFILEGDKGLEHISSDIIQKLKDLSFLVDKSINEFKQHIDDTNKKREEDHGLFLTIIPSFSCNLNCIYCYERKTKKVMNNAIQEKIAEFITQKYNTEGIRNPLKVYWFGGEPLLVYL